MKKTSLFGINALVLIVTFLILAISCKKDNDDPETIKDVDGNIYHMVTIGSQVWLVENLKTTTYNNGVSIPPVTGNSAWEALAAPGYCWYGNDLSKKTSYGALYNWYAISEGNLCPTGWHVPSVTEWTTLLTHIGGYEGGGKLKETGTTHWMTPNTGATDEIGFTALPGGYRYNNGTFYELGEQGYWWSSTLLNATQAYNFHLSSANTRLGQSADDKEYGYSCRCIKD